MHSLSLRTIICSLGIIAASTALPAQPSPAPDCNTGRVGPPKTDPRHPYMHCFEPWAIMRGWLSSCVNPVKTEGFGSRIVALGDVNHDDIADFAVERTRCDTAFVEGTPIDWHVYFGVKGGVPHPQGGQRIGPREVHSQTTILCAGDWDNDANTDLAVTFTILGDTTGGDTVGYGTRRVCVFWGTADGTYSIDDTSRLIAFNDLWRTAYRAVSADFDGDTVDDLIVWGGGSFVNGTPITTARLHLYQGQDRARWGVNGTLRTASLSWWNVPPFNYLQVTDQDCDGYADIVLLNQFRSTDFGTVSVLYGRANALPDTASVESVDLTAANGHWTLVIDVTGDRVPEIVTNCGFDQVLRVFAGRPGQRLHAMYGSGNEHGRPWLTVPLPKKVNPDDWFSAGFEPLYDLGDGNLDGIADIWMYNFPFFSCYVTGIGFDRFIDAGMRWGAVINATRLGDIDGSNLPSFAVSFSGTPGGFALYKATAAIPSSAEWIALPHPESFLCHQAASVPTPLTHAHPPALTAIPNPSRGEITLRWNTLLPNSASIVTLVTSGGDEALRLDLPSGHQQITFSTQGLAADAYLAVLHAGEQRIATNVIIE